MEFGSKKAKKAIQESAINAVTPQGASATNDPATAAVLKSLEASAKNAPTKQVVQAAVDEARPGPKPHFDASSPADIYSVEGLVGKDVLGRVRVKDWVDAIQRGIGIQSESSFVVHRIQAIVGANDIRKLKVLGYLLLVLKLYLAVDGQTKGSRKKYVPKREVLREKMNVDDSWIETLRKQFVPEQ